LTCGQLSGLLEHDVGKGEDVETGKGAGVVLVILDEPQEAFRPGG
jgi:hypothetical protein